MGDLYHITRKCACSKPFCDGALEQSSILVTYLLTNCEQNSRSCSSSQLGLFDWSVIPITEPETDLAYLRNKKAKAEQQLRFQQNREKILEHQLSRLNRRERVHRLCTRAGMLESFLIAPEELTNNQVMELLKIAFRQPEVALALAKMIHDLQEQRSA